MKEISFSVQGSDPTPYEVTFLKESDSKVMVLCSCPAGMNSQYCKHRLAIIDGDTSAIVSDNVKQVAVIKTWLTGTPLEHIIAEYRETEARATAIKLQLSKVKRAMARIMQNG
jgi:uncharacterized Zn finger protein